MLIELLITDYLEEPTEKKAARLEEYAAMCGYPSLDALINKYVFKNALVVGEVWIDDTGEIHFTSDKEV